MYHSPLLHVDIQGPGSFHFLSPHPLGSVNGQSEWPIDDWLGREGQRWTRSSQSLSRPVGDSHYFCSSPLARNGHVAVPNSKGGCP